MDTNTTVCTRSLLLIQNAKGQADKHENEQGHQNGIWHKPATKNSFESDIDCLLQRRAPKLKSEGLPRTTQLVTAYQILSCLQFA